MATEDANTSSMRFMGSMAQADASDVYFFQRVSCFQLTHPRLSKLDFMCIVSQLMAPSVQHLSRCWLIQQVHSEGPNTWYGVWHGGQKALLSSVILKLSSGRW